MHLSNFMNHDLAVTISFIACIVGLLLLRDRNQQEDNDLAITEIILLRMSFTYWLVYCFAFATQKIVSPNLEIVLISLKITAIISYFLTFSCIISLPLHRFATHEVED